MSTTHDVISAFLDNEPFDRDALLAALSDPAGRTLLVDLAALRQIVQPSEDAPAFTVPAPPRQPRWRVLAAAAALLIAVVGGYAAGTRQSGDTPAAAPTPTRVVQAVPFTPAGGRQ